MGIIEDEIKQLERMFDVAIEKFEEAEEKLVVYVSSEKIGRAIGPEGAVVKAAELVLGRAIEVKSL